MDFDRRFASKVGARLGIALIIGFSHASLAQTVHNLTNLPAESFIVPSQGAVDHAGSAVYVVSSSNQFGTNPRYFWQVFRWDPASGMGSQVTSFDKGVESVTVSDDGQWLALVSCSDLVGSNHDGSAELYVMRPDGTGIAQLTNDSSLDAGTVYNAMIAGSGNRVAFVADTDPLGMNTDRRRQIFIVDRGGTGLRQLTSAVTDPWSAALSISDDGNRIAFTNYGDLTGENPGGLDQVFAILADGTSLRQLTHMTDGFAAGAVVSGNGSRVAFYASGSGAGWRVSKIEWDGMGLVDLASGPDTSDPSITDDGGTVVYEGSNHQIWKVGADGTGNAQLTSGAVLGNGVPAISGDGSRIVFLSAGGEYPGGDNPDGGRELTAMDSAGANLRQLTRLSVAGYGYGPEITRDGTRVFFVSDGSTGVWGNIYRIQADGTGWTPVTALVSQHALDIAASPDGNVVVFSTYPDGGSGYGYDIFKVNADGTGMTRLNPFSTGSISGGPVISADGQWVVFESTLHQGGNSDGSAEVFRVKMDGTLFTAITADDDTSYPYAKSPRLSDGSPVPWIVYQSASDKDGQNPDGSVEIFRVRLTGAPVLRVTSDPQYDSFDPDISGDGNRVVYASETDPLGTNPEHNDEIFLYDVSTATRRQLTLTVSGESYQPRITRDGLWVYFRSSAPFFDSNRDEHYEPYRLSVATGLVERLGGTRSCGATVRYDAVTVDGFGTRAVFTGSGQWDGQNPDRADDVYLVDFAASPMLHIGKSAPTLVSWDPQPKPVRYDVIRGAVANLQSGGGATVDLGPVACMEDDSPDADTTGFEDAVQPSVSQVFFYLLRGTQGGSDGSGSWGQGSGGEERTAGADACSP